MPFKPNLRLRRGQCCSSVVRGSMRVGGHEWACFDRHCLKIIFVLFVCLNHITALFSTCRPYRDRQRPANGTQCPTLTTDS